MEWNNCRINYIDTTDHKRGQLPMIGVTLEISPSCHGPSDSNYVMVAAAEAHQTLVSRV